MADVKISALPAATSVSTSDLLVIVQGDVTKSAPVSLLPSSGVGSVSSLIRPESYGAKGDGIILNDLQATAGSTTITSPSGPFTSTAVDKDKLVYWWAGGDAYGTGVIASVQSATQATLKTGPQNGSQVPGGPNTNAVFGTDNTLAINSALTEAQARKVAAPALVRDFRPAGEIRFGRGVYVTKPTNALTQVGVTVSGEGKYGTFVAICEDGAAFSLSAFSNTADTYAGTATHFTARGIHFINPCYRSGSTVGQRKGVGIQDNGSGNLNVIECYFTALKYGVCLAYGSDFDLFRDSYWEFCDVGLYVGGGSQQIKIGKCDFYFCREGIVSEGAQQWHISDTSWENSIIADVNIEAKTNGNTRMGLPVYAGSQGPGNGYYYAGMWTMDNCWFESYAGGYGDIAPRHVWLNGQGPNGNYQERVTIRDSIVVSGGNQDSGGTAAFVEVLSAYAPPLPVIISNLRIAGNHINYVVRNSGSGGDIQARIEDVALPTGVQARSSGVTT